MRKFRIGDHIRSRGELAMVLATQRSRILVQPFPLVPGARTYWRPAWGVLPVEQSKRCPELAAWLRKQAA